MNKKGQTLLAFILILPIIILFFAFVIDTGYILKENTKLNNLTQSILKDVGLNTENYEEKIKDLYKINNQDLESLTIDKTSDSLSINASKNIPSIFGSIIGLKNYSLQTKMKLTMKDEKIIILKE